MFQGAIWVPLRSRPLPPLLAARTLGHGLRGDRGDPWENGSDGNVQPMLRGRWGFICCPACWWTRASRFEKAGLHMENVWGSLGIGNWDEHGWNDEHILHLKHFETSSIQGKLRIGAGSELSWTFYSPWCLGGTFSWRNTTSSSLTPGTSIFRECGSKKMGAGDVQAHKPWDVMTHHLHKGPWLCWKVFPQLRLLPSASNEEHENCQSFVVPSCFIARFSHRSI